MSFDMYREIILDHYKNPRNQGTISPADAMAEKSNPLCGDEMQISLALEKGTIRDINFTGVGCSVSRAGGSILTEMVKGKKVADIDELTDEKFIKDMGVPVTPARRKCALLGLHTLRLALEKDSKK